MLPIRKLSSIWGDGHATYPGWSLPIHTCAEIPHCTPKTRAIIMSIKNKSKCYFETHPRDGETAQQVQSLTV